MKSPYSLVLVKWRDATGNQTWTDMKEAIRKYPPTCVTVGWLIHKDADKVVIVDSHTETEGDEDVSGRSTIPTGMVKKIIKLGKKYDWNPDPE